MIITSELIPMIEFHAPQAMVRWLMTHVEPMPLPCKPHALMFTSAHLPAGT